MRRTFSIRIADTENKRFQKIKFDLEMYKYNLEKIFQRPLLKIEIKGNSIEMEAEFKVPKKPVAFLGMIVDLEDGGCYLTHYPNTQAVRIGNLGELVEKILGFEETGWILDRETALFFLEKFKLTGDLAKACNFILDEDLVRGSYISYVLCGGDSLIKGIEIPSKRAMVDVIESMYSGIRNANSYLCSLLGELIKYLEENGSNDVLIEELFETFMGFGLDSEVYRAVADAGKQIGNSFYSLVWGDYLSFRDGEYNEGEVLRICTMSQWTEHRHSAGNTGGSGTVKKIPLLVDNCLEVCEAMDEGEAIYSSDYKKKLVDLGFDGILTGRELSYVTKKDFIDGVRNKENNNPDLTSIDEFTYRRTPKVLMDIQYTQSLVRDQYLYEKDMAGIKARASIQQLAKCVGRVLDVMK